MKIISYGILVVAVLFGVVYANFYIKRTINYNWCYKDAVKQTIHEETKSLQDRIVKLEWEVNNLKTNR